MTDTSAQLALSQSELHQKAALAQAMPCIVGFVHEKELEKELFEAQRVCEYLFHAIEGLSEQARSSQLPGPAAPHDASENRLDTPASRALLMVPAIATVAPAIATVAPKTFGAVTHCHLV